MALDSSTTPADRSTSEFATHHATVFSTHTSRMLGFGMLGVATPHATVCSTHTSRVLGGAGRWGPQSAEFGARLHRQIADCAPAVEQMSAAVQREAGRATSPRLPYHQRGDGGEPPGLRPRVVQAASL